MALSYRQVETLTNQGSILHKTGNLLQKPVLRASSPGCEQSLESRITESVWLEKTSESSEANL